MIKERHSDADVNTWTEDKLQKIAGIAKDLILEEIKKVKKKFPQGGGSLSEAWLLTYVEDPIRKIYNGYPNVQDVVVTAIADVCNELIDKGLLKLNGKIFLIQ
ncbi:MAG: hypothetical protein BWK78_04330 [Thiotrichaceae bacterium IS1]|nr:MAG: hypothetical protein BWK78_04330 [Thiotrichaceae bacterium IS1]